MKSKTILVGMIVAGVALSSTSVLADTQGTQTFTANITESTCLVSGVDRSVDLGPISKNDGTLAAGKLYRVFPINISGCGSAFTSVVMTPTFDQIASTDTSGSAQNKGTAVVDATWGVSANGLVSENTDLPTALQSGKKVTVPLTAGATEIDVLFGMNAAFHLSSNVRSGTLNYPLLLAFDFK